MQILFLKKRYIPYNCKDCLSKNFVRFVFEIDGIPVRDYCSNCGSLNRVYAKKKKTKSNTPAPKSVIAFPDNMGGINNRHHTEKYCR